MIDIKQLLSTISLPDMFPAGALRSVAQDKYMTKCIFHGERTASMVVNRFGGKWLFRCWSCGVQGDAIEFVMLRDKVGKGEAIRLLAGDREFLVVDEKRDYGEKNDSTYILVCDAPGCTMRGNIEAEDRAFVGHTKAVAWGHKDGRTYCPRCIRNQGEK